MPILSHHRHQSYLETFLVVGKEFDRSSLLPCNPLALMKFGRLFEAALKGEDYPKHWVETAISYKQLKKCIKNVQKELSDLGFGPEMVERLWNGSFDNATSPSGPLQYVIAGLI